MSLDISKLENVRRTANGMSARCPMCASFGRDKAGEHLSILSDGKYNCIAYSNDSEHNKGIYKLVGTGEINNDSSIFIQEKIEIERIYDKKCLDKLIKDYSYWNKRGISNEVISKFNGGIATEGQMKNRWVFPLFNENEQIVGFTGRALFSPTDIPWKIIGQKTKCIFGDIDEIESTKRIILVESIGDFLMLSTHGVKDVLVLFGTNLYQTLLGKIISLNPDEIIISTNNDIKHTVGQNAADKILNILIKFFNKEKIKIILPEAKDWGEETKENIQKYLNNEHTNTETNQTV